MIASLKNPLPPPIKARIERKLTTHAPPIANDRFGEAVFSINVDSEQLARSPTVAVAPVIATVNIETETAPGYISPEMFGNQSRFKVPKIVTRFASPFFVSLICHTLVLLALTYATQTIAPPSKFITLNLSETDEDDRPVTIDSASMSVLSTGEVTAPIEPPSSATNATTNFREAALQLLADSPPISSELSLAGEGEGAVPFANLAHEFETDISRKSRDGRDNTHQTQFFGIQSAGNRFVFVIDSSRSMSGRRWTRACKELWKSLDGLHPDQEFFIICFDMETHLMLKQKPEELTMMNATDENITKAQRWTRSVRFGKRTFPMFGLQCALSLKPDAVYLLSDGEFHDDSRRYLRNNNRTMGDDRIVRVHTPIHTIAFDSVAGGKILKSIAVEQDGKFRFVD